MKIINPQFNSRLGDAGLSSPVQDRRDRIAQFMSNWASVRRPTPPPPPPAPAPAAPQGPSVYDQEFAALKASERRRVGEEFSEARQGLERRIYSRGLGRSGFAAEAMSKLGAKEGGALADVESGVSDRLMNYKWNMRSMQVAGKKKKKKLGGIGAALGIAGLVLAPFTGGASLALTATGAGMMMSGT